MAVSPRGCIQVAEGLVVAVGGLFAFAGLLRNRALGSYRAFVTDLDRTLVLDHAGRALVAGSA